MYPNKNIYNGENYLKEIYIPANVTSMGINAFGSATSDVIITIENPASG